MTPSGTAISGRRDAVAEPQGRALLDCVDLDLVEEVPVDEIGLLREGDARNQASPLEFFLEVSQEDLLLVLRGPEKDLSLMVVVIPLFRSRENSTATSTMTASMIPVASPNSSQSETTEPRASSTTLDSAPEHPPITYELAFPLWPTTAEQNH